MEAQQPYNVLEIAEAHFQRVLGERERDGDPTVIVHRYEGPWRTDALGPGIETVCDLKALYSTVLTGGLRQTFDPQGRLLPWLDNAQAVISCFFDTLRDANDRQWRPFENGLYAIWQAIDAEKAELDEEGSDELRSPWLLNPFMAAERWQRAKPSLAQSRCIAIELASTALADALTSAFARGQILVFERRGSIWEPRPPEIWNSSPPLRAPTPAEIRLKRDAEEFSILQAEIKRLEHEKRLSVFGFLSDLEIQMLKISASVLAHSAAELKSFEQRRVKEAENFAFLLSKDISSFLIGGPSSLTVSDFSRSKPGPKPKKHLYAKYAKEGAGLRRKGVVSSNIKAANAMIKKYPEIEKIADTPEAAREQLRKEIGSCLNSSDLPQ